MLRKLHVPENCREILIDWHHESLQHRGKESMIRTTVNEFKWTGWTANIDGFVSSCELFQKCKTTGV